jgi:hypothetical protein
MSDRRQQAFPTQAFPGRQTKILPQPRTTSLRPRDAAVRFPADISSCRIQIIGSTAVEYQMSRRNTSRYRTPISELSSQGTGLFKLGMRSVAKKICEQGHLNGYKNSNNPLTLVFRLRGRVFGSMIGALKRGNRNFWHGLAAAFPDQPAAVRGFSVAGRPAQNPRADYGGRLGVHLDRPASETVSVSRRVIAKPPKVNGQAGGDFMSRPAKIP